MTDTAKPSEQFAEITAFLDTLSDVDPDAPTFCAGWTAHDLLAHLVAGGDEMRRLVATKLAGRPVPATLPFAEREAAFVALPDDELRDRMGRPGLLVALDELHDRDPSATVAFTGAELTATGARSSPSLTFSRTGARCSGRCFRSPRPGIARPTIGQPPGDLGTSTLTIIRGSRVAGSLLQSTESC